MDLGLERNEEMGWDRVLIATKHELLLLSCF